MAEDNAMALRNGHIVSRVCLPAYRADDHVIEGNDPHLCEFILDSYLGCR